MRRFISFTILHLFFFLFASIFFSPLTSSFPFSFLSLLSLFLESDPTKADVIRWYLGEVEGELQTVAQVRLGRERREEKGRGWLPSLSLVFVFFSFFTLTSRSLSPFLSFSFFSFSLLYSSCPPAARGGADRAASAAPPCTRGRRTHRSARGLGCSCPWCVPWKKEKRERKGFLVVALFSTCHFFVVLLRVWLTLCLFVFSLFVIVPHPSLTFFFSLSSLLSPLSPLSLFSLRSLFSLFSLFSSLCSLCSLCSLLFSRLSLSLLQKSLQRTRPICGCWWCTPTTRKSEGKDNNEEEE